MKGNLMLTQLYQTREGLYWPKNHTPLVGAAEGLTPPAIPTNPVRALESHLEGLARPLGRVDALALLLLGGVRHGD